MTNQYRKKPVVIEAFELPIAPYDGSTNEIHEENVWSFIAWAKKVGFTNWTSEGDGYIAIDTLEGKMTASPGDWIIKGVKGEFYPCKPDIFAVTYEAAEQAATAPAPAREIAELQAEIERLTAIVNAPRGDMKEAIAQAYGYLWYVVHPDVDGDGTLSIDPYQASYAARRALRELLTSEQRGQAINAVRAEIRAGAPEAKAC
ncbi:hypothetical protein [Burkholderia anthina]|uniref:hypothetical protein n=1 Tax=Burkholderia anthina TaxID=179879 RepID=UPI001ABB72CF|nr:hypothetical protein [Burkholderia anthina]